MHEKFSVMNNSGVKKKKSKFTKNTCAQESHALQYCINTFKQAFYIEIYPILQTGKCSFFSSLTKRVDKKKTTLPIHKNVMKSSEFYHSIL